MWIRRGVFLLTATAIACAPPASKARPRDYNVLTAEEIATSQTTTAYDAIRNLRPHYLRTRGTHTLDPAAALTVHVFFNGQRYGDIETLKTISAQTIREIRYLGASDATTKYGIGYTYGAIEVFSR